MSSDVRYYTKIFLVGGQTWLIFACELVYSASLHIFSIFVSKKFMNINCLGEAWMCLQRQNSEACSLDSI